jgi:hypothetical protein
VVALMSCPTYCVIVEGHLKLVATFLGAHLGR